MQSHADPLPGAILIVEDDAGVAELIAELLREQGCLTAHAATGAEALTWLAGHRPALVLLDYALPDMTGLQFLDRAGAPLPFIVTTGAGDERTAVELMKHGARDYVIKGTGFLANLTLAVRRVLNHLATERQLAQVREALLLSEARQKADQRRAEADREHMRAQLLQAQKLESIGTLASGVAHEINNPIMGIMGYAQLILDRLGPDSPVAGYATEIVRESDRVAMIVKHLLSFARSESQLASPARAYDIVEDTLSLVRAVLRHDQIAIEVDVPADLPLLTCRSQQIRQVVMNMLTNARDALNQRYPGHAANKVVRISARVIEKAVSSGQSAVNSEQ